VLMEDHFWAALCRALELDGLESVGVVERVQRKEELDALVAGALAAMPTEKALARLEEHDLPAAPVLTRAEMLEHEHFRARGTVIAESPGAEVPLPALGHPARYALHPARELGPVPEVDETAEGSWLPR
jgi:crotonobetainyl-CoA:carnitine CoA-transferase CaiB-like acyl-CoA transferase